MRKQKKDEKCNKDVKKLQEVCFKNWLGFMIVKTHLGGLTLNSFCLLLPPRCPTISMASHETLSNGATPLDYNAQTEPHMPGD